MFDHLLNPAFTGTDIALLVVVLVAACLGDRYDRNRNNRTEKS